MTWDCGAGHYFDFLLRRCTVLNIFPFPVTTAKLIGKFYNNRRSAARGCSHFACSFVFLMLRQYYWRCDLYAANRWSAANKHKSKYNLLALRMLLASPIGLESMTRFAYERRAQRSANNINCAVFTASILLALRRSYRLTYFSRTCL